MLTATSTSNTEFSVKIQWWRTVVTIPLTGFCFGEAFDPRFFTSTHEPATREGWEPTGDFSGGNRVGGTQDPYGKIASDSK